MYNWYKGLIEIKKMYPKGAKLKFHEWGKENVLILQVQDANGAPQMAIYINVGLEPADPNYNLNPDEVVGAPTTNVKTLGGAPSEKGGNIGTVKWSVSAFKK